MENIRRRYRGRGVAFFLLYSREEHPGAFWPQTYKAEDRIDQARRAARKLGTTAAVLVEPPGEHVRASYGLKPNRLFVVDRDATIVLVQEWAFPAALERTLEELVGYDPR